MHKNGKLIIVLVMICTIVLAPIVITMGNRYSNEDKKNIAELFATINNANVDIALQNTKVSISSDVEYYLRVLEKRRADIEPIQISTMYTSNNKLYINVYIQKRELIVFTKGWKDLNKVEEVIQGVK